MEVLVVTTLASSVIAGIAAYIMAYDRLCNCGHRARRASAPTVSRMTSPAAGPSDMATATARFASTIGVGSYRISSP